MTFIYFVSGPATKESSRGAFGSPTTITPVGVSPAFLLNLPRCCCCGFGWKILPERWLWMTLYVKQHPRHGGE